MQPKVEHYNYDFYAGLNYTLDLRRPLGQRVVGLSLPDGSPLGEEEISLVYQQLPGHRTGGYDVLRSCPVLWRGGVEMPDLTAQYIQRHSPVRPGLPGQDGDIALKPGLTERAVYDFNKCCEQKERRWIMERFELAMKGIMSAGAALRQSPMGEDQVSRKTDHQDLVTCRDREIEQMLRREILGQHSHGPGGGGGIP